MLYEVAIIEKPTPTEKKSSKNERIILPPTAIIAVDENAASLKAGRMADFDGVKVEDNIEVMVRPFL